MDFPASGTINDVDVKRKLETEMVYLWKSFAGKQFQDFRLQRERTFACKFLEG